VYIVKISDTNLFLIWPFIGDCSCFLVEDYILVWDVPIKT
jgi:hypothetical protein